MYGPPTENWPVSTEDKLASLAASLGLTWCESCQDWEPSPHSGSMTVPTGNPDLGPGPL